MEKDKDFYLEDLMREECLCGRIKASGRSFCFQCYMELPGDKQKALYKRIGQGYEASFEDAVKYLQDNVW